MTQRTHTLSTGDKSGKRGRWVSRRPRNPKKSCLPESPTDFDQVMMFSYSSARETELYEKIGTTKVESLMHFITLFQGVELTSNDMTGLKNTGEK